MKNVKLAQGFASSTRGAIRKTTKKLNGGFLPPYKPTQSTQISSKVEVCGYRSGDTIIVAFPYRGYNPSKDTCDGWAISPKGTRLKKRVSLRNCRKVSAKTLLSESDWIFATASVNFPKNSYRVTLTSLSASLAAEKAAEKAAKEAAKLASKEAKEAAKLASKEAKEAAKLASKEAKEARKTRKRVSLSEGLSILLEIGEKKQRESLNKKPKKQRKQRIKNKKVERENYETLSMMRGAKSKAKHRIGRKVETFYHKANFAPVKVR